MSVFSEWLETYFEEVSPREFYRVIFPEGELQQRGDYRSDGGVYQYNGIAVSISREKVHGKPKVRRYTVTDDLDVIEQLCGTDDFCLMSPISYVGKARTADNARFLYAFAVDLDHIKVKDGDPVGLRSLMERHVNLVDRIPKPTFIVSSGTGVHLYYVLTEPVAMFRDSSKDLQSLKRDLTTLIWHDSIVDITSEKDIQQEGVYQGFRMPGTITKAGDRARAFQVGDKISIEELQRYTAELRHGREKKFKKKKAITLQIAKDRYPDWYERRVVKKEKLGTWHVSRNLYDWWKRQIYSGATVGHRYYCMMMLAIYARKCSMHDDKHNPNPVTREELESDAYAIMDYMESLTVSDDNHFTTADVLDALEAFDDKWITYPRNSVEYKSGITIPANKRNGRKQEEHIKLMNFVRDNINQNDNWREGNGRKRKEGVVQEWQLQHPAGTKAACVRDTGLDRKTVSRWWRTMEQ